MQTILFHARTTANPAAAEGNGESRTSNRSLHCAQGEGDSRNQQSPAFAPRIILVPVTLSNRSYPTLAIAKNLACESNAKLVLLHVVQLNIVGEEFGIPRTRLLHELCRNAEMQLRELAICMGGQTTAEILVCEGRPAEAIVATATRLEADTIVMRIDRHRRWLKWLHRNTALHVARQAPCRVWLVFPGKHAETVNLMMVDHTSINRLSQRLAFQESQNPFRSLLRLPFS
jgi:nucleotide-binding universal stress UspA family protein